MHPVKPAGLVAWVPARSVTFEVLRRGDDVALLVDELDARLGDGDGLAAAWNAAAEKAVEAGKATADLTPKIGRARPLAERSVGTPDAGATSMGLVVTAVGEVLSESCGGADQ